MDLSIIIPLLNEEESLKELHDWIVKVMRSNQFTYEILFIDDGSTDGSWKTITELSHSNPNVKGIRFNTNFGKSQALHAGFKAAKGNVVITMDADLQDNPEEIPELYRLIKEDKFDLVSGWKKKRYDSVLFKNMPSKLFNWAARQTSGVKLHDFNCGLKAFDQKVIKSIEVSGEMHRYIPVLAKNAGYGNIGEKIVKHQARKYGKTKFGMERFINGFLDLLTIWFVSKFGRQPMHLFGALGVLMFIIGFGFAIYLGIDKLFINPYGRLITDRPQFFIALTAMIIGTQLFLAGFLGEILIRSRKNETRYTISEEIYPEQKANEYSS
ncbi:MULTISPECIES: glycosyltransferase family 2 protein [Zobellia]|uniref:Undecaprenyl-phosphate 4-deoxy-4-formamido-L-arabinose transferase, family GT2 n=1 Tax=Zobellia galactanivorans (strain DSM 12802 / CCUG 47099 / CIP 106680 / NCIMB 13871 / Dsij) TaxID=63186 RepID=G0L8T9_ZOBGA|nr:MULTISPECIES: glycosyltransferase family 2 protein [Zobellia]MBU3027184.1 glycosyltransferase [Zobellia galactanivorans]OWW24793.1 glycosyltransferase [Zobellia sp. OII3]CAZ94157.1 Undecaprenyl-phosphate 4-deoxy-4-formamido-L-arabinose transferase, family GT2 [Zobellia galactanivorans]